MTEPTVPDPSEATSRTALPAPVPPGRPPTQDPAAGSPSTDGTSQQARELVGDISRLEEAN